MKYALKQSAKLNTEYEKAMRRISKQFGLNFDKVLGISETKIKSREKMRDFRKGNTDMRSNVIHKKELSRRNSKNLAT